MNIGPISITLRRKAEPRALVVTRATSKAQREAREKLEATNARLAAEIARSRTSVPGRVG